MPTVLPQGYTIFGGLKFGTPFVDDFQRRFDAIVGQVGSQAASVNAALGGPGGVQAPSRDLGQFGPVGGGAPRSGGGAPGGAAGATGIPAPPGGVGAGAPQARTGGGGLPSPPGGGGRATNGASAGQANRANIPNLNNL